MTKVELDRPKRELRDLRELTQARVLLGRFGAGLPTRAVQSFQLDHARARQAVWPEVDRIALRQELSDLAVDIADVESMAENREEFVRRPDLGRKLSREVVPRLATLPLQRDVVIILADGLSASAVKINGASLTRAIVRRLHEAAISVGSIVLAAQARVALADPIGELLQARVSIMLIGERPGLSAADSLGAYLTYRPETGTPDSRRNCISNIRNGGLAVTDAADAVVALVITMLKTQVSGVGLHAAAAKLPTSCCP
jgi:ethanolamine ammonia-lyase small subunit